MPTMIAFPATLEVADNATGLAPAPGTAPVAVAGTALAPPPLPALPADTESLGDEIARLAAHLHAATYHLLVLIREFDQREGWGGGFLSCAQWLSWRTGIGPGPAREKVRVARALGSLPRISGAMARGQLSYSKVRALTRVASPENEAELLEVARHATAAHVEKLVRAWRTVDRLAATQEEERRHQSRFLRLYRDDEGSYVLRGRLDPEVGALLEQALEWAGEALYREAVRNGSDATAEQRRADALGLVAERAMAGAAAELGEREGGRGEDRVPHEEAPALGRADRFQVILHVEAGDLGTGPTHGHLLLADGGADGGADDSADGGADGSADGGADGSADGGADGPGERSGRRDRDQTFPRRRRTSEGSADETSRRLACDSSLVLMTHDEEGRVLDVGRKRRTVPPALRRALDYRDKGCRFPGCGCRYTDAHHVAHWADGGETKLDNLVLLCRRHHRAVHEEGVRVELAEGGKAVRFFGPSGRAIPEAPQPPALPAEPVRELVRVHRERGITPDAWTATPLWHGEPLDCGLAIDMFRALGP
jgi:hypothetical protein